MPDPIKSDQTLTPPPAFPEMTDFPTVPTINQDANTTPTAPVNNVPSDSGQASGPTDIPPMIANAPKRKSPKMIATILGIFILIGAVGAGVILVGQKQLFEQKASGCSWDSDNEMCGGTCGANTRCTQTGAAVCVCLFICDSGLSCTVNGGVCYGGASACNSLGNAKCCCPSGQTWSDGAQECIAAGVCLPGSTKSCTESNGCAGTQTCDVIGTWSPCVQNDSSCGAATPTPTPTSAPAGCNFNSSCLATRREWMPNHPICGTCTNGTTICGTWEGEAGVQKAACCNGVSDCNISPKCSGSYPWCFNGWCLSSNTSNREGCYPDASRCASILPCESPVPSPSGTPKPTSTPTIPPTTPQCTSVKAYDTNWKLLTAAQLSALTAGKVVRFTISGTPASEIDKARFTINGSLKPDVGNDKKKPGTDEYYIEYTIPANVFSFTVTAQIHHKTIGWF